MKINTILIAALTLTLGTAYANSDVIQSSLNSVSYGSVSQSTWQSEAKNLYNEHYDFATMTGFGGIFPGTSEPVGSIGLCVSGKHVNEDSPVCSFSSGSKSKGYSISISGNQVGIGIAAVVVGQYGDPNVTKVVPIQIESVDSSCKEYANKNDRTNWWEYTTNAWDSKEAETFRATVNIEGNGTSESHYYFGLSDCSLSNS
ncbi:hypothetical protein L3V82_01205 [Thiotrichales bacterium 19S3-7]|nr:hypothetical protein [Thiotrichales bacterium 19S3-7]MCF6800779.1 hypothetical protein [Thiotrichales bacterium 19S3-11]